MRERQRDAQREREGRSERENSHDILLFTENHPYHFYTPTYALPGRMTSFLLNKLLTICFIMIIEWIFFADPCPLKPFEQCSISSPMNHLFGGFKHCFTSIKHCLAGGQACFSKGWFNHQAVITYHNYRSYQAALLRAGDPPAPFLTPQLSLAALAHPLLPLHPRLVRNGLASQPHFGVFLTDSEDTPSWYHGGWRSAT